MENTNIMKTPLNSAHRELGGKMVDFAGWDMPVQYTGVIDEHLAVRTKAGLFDVSHMGEIMVTGPDAQLLLNRITSNNVAKLKPGKIHYTGLLTEQGTFVDDLLIYCYSDEKYFVVANAANVDKDFAFIQKYADGDVKVENVSDSWAQIAIQGPEAEAILQQLTELNLAEMIYYTFEEGSVNGAFGLVSRTGYTAEDGFEIYCKPEDAEAIWKAIMAKGQPAGLQPCGLAARDTLRLEGKMALYGNDIDDTTTVLEADLGWLLKLKKKVDFNGKEILKAQKADGTSRKLVGFEMLDKGIARHGYPVFVAGEEVGKVTSGTFAPFLKKNIGLAYLPSGSTEIGTEFEIGVRKKQLKAVVVATPFYKREK
jgi:aminomethyltransferase